VRESGLYHELTMRLASGRKVHGLITKEADWQIKTVIKDTKLIIHDQLHVLTPEGD
jgi:hypothetical protein